MSKFLYFVIFICLQQYCYSYIALESNIEWKCYESNIKISVKIQVKNNLFLKLFYTFKKLRKLRVCWIHRRSVATFDTGSIHLLTIFRLFIDYFSNIKCKLQKLSSWSWWNWHGAIWTFYKCMHLKANKFDAFVLCVDFVLLTQYLMNVERWSVLCTFQNNVMQKILNQPKVLKVFDRVLIAW